MLCAHQILLVMVALQVGLVGRYVHKRRSAMKSLNDGASDKFDNVSVASVANNDGERAPSSGMVASGISRNAVAAVPAAPFSISRSTVAQGLSRALSRLGGSAPPPQALPLPQARARGRDGFVGGSSDRLSESGAGDGSMGSSALRYA
jgi:hypothetical protein